MGRSFALIGIVAAAAAAACSRGDPPGVGRAHAAEARTATATPTSTATPTATPTSTATATSTSTPTAPPAGPPNVLLVTIDSLRADMPWNGYERPIAPRLTALEKRAVSYTRAYALSSYTSMSIGGLLGGRLPGEMKRDGYFFGTYPKDVLMFPERLQAAGVRTLGAHGHTYFKPGSGFSQGFDDWKVVPGITFNSTTDENVTGAKMEKMAEEMLSDPANTGGRFFAWFHFMDPHDQYLRHKETRDWGPHGRDLYDGEVEYTDVQVGRLLDFVEKQPWASRTIIIVSADHGEVFGEHGLYRHGFELWEPLVHVPLWFVVPGVAPRHVDAKRSHLDLAPTILDLLGAPPEPSFRGRSLVGEVLGREPADDRDVLVDLPRTSDNDRRRAILHGKHKLIAFGDDAYFQVFDLESDPDEKKSIEKTDRAVFDEMVGLYRAKSKEIKDIGPYACRKLKGAPEGRGY